jgi:hypothetical protein
MKLVLDQFYRDPDSLRELALELEFTSRARNFPGSRSTRTVIPKEAQDAFASILKVFIDDPKNRIPYNGCFQLMLAADAKRAYVHADISAAWAAIVYLSEKTEPLGGTSFFRHKATGLDRFPDTNDEELKTLLREDRSKKTKWTEIDRIGFVYNRFVLYDAQLFHKNGKTWGNSLPSGRLTHNFFA